MAAVTAVGLAAASGTSCAGARASEQTEQTEQVELLEEEVVQLVGLATGRARTVPRLAVPAGAREGDVLVDGRLDPALTAQLRAQVRALREQLARPVPVGLDLDDDGR